MKFRRYLSPILKLLGAIIISVITYSFFQEDGYTTEHMSWIIIVPYLLFGGFLEILIPPYTSEGLNPKLKLPVGILTVAFVSASVLMAFYLYAMEDVSGSISAFVGAFLVLIVFAGHLHYPPIKY